MFVYAKRDVFFHLMVVVMVGRSNVDESSVIQGAIGQKIGDIVRSEEE